MTIWLRRVWDDPVAHTPRAERFDLPAPVRSAVTDQITFADRPRPAQRLRATGPG